MEEKIALLLIALLSFVLLAFLLVNVPPIEYVKVEFEPLQYGSTFLSVSKIEFVNQPVANLKPPIWAITLTASGLAQHLEGKVSSDQLTTPDGSKARYGFKIEQDLLDAKYKYPIYRDFSYPRMKTYFYKTWSCFLLPSEQDAINNCGPNTEWYGKFPDSFTCFCVAVEYRAIPGRLDSPIIYTKSQFKLTTDDGKVYTQTIESYGTNIEGKLGDYAYIKYIGSLTTRYAPSPSDYKPYYENFRWDVGLKSKFDIYWNELQSFEAWMNDAAKGVITITEDALRDRITRLKNAYDEYINSRPPFDFTVGNQNSVDEAYMLVNFNLADAVPMYLLYVSADLLQIYQPRPLPKIVDVSALNVYSGGSPRVYVTIKNEGDKGNIWVGGTCSYTSLFPKEVGFNSGEQKVVILEGTVSPVSSEVRDTCVIKACALGTTICDERSTSFTISPIKVCTPNEKRCSPTNTQVIEICNPEGTAWKIFETCAPNHVCMYVQGEPKCVSLTQQPQPSQPQPQQPTQKFEIKQTLKDLFTVVLLVVLPLIGFFREYSKDKNIYRAIFSLLLFFLIGYVIWYLMNLEWWQYLIAAALFGGAIYILLTTGWLWIILGIIVSKTTNK